MGNSWPLWLALALVSVGFVALRAAPAVRVGDGSEYYAMFLAWRDTARPFMTEAAWQAYARLFDGRSIVGLLSAENLRTSFPALITGATADFNHFWLYSGLAAALSRVGGVVGLRIGPHGSFILLHWLMMVGLLTLGWRLYGWRGVVAIVLLFVSSPALWYANKVHTEWFTICATTAAVACLLRRHLVGSALFLAVASTQNISFAAVSGFVLLLDIWRRGWRGPYSLTEVAMIAATVLLVLIHPVYYFARFGVITPQLLAGGASIGANLSTAPLWLLDPDVGLLPNWPLAVVALIVAALAGRHQRSGHVSEGTRISAPVLWLVVIVYLAVNLFAQASTTNLNSAGSPGPSRYGFWYIALLLPAFLRMVSWSTPYSGRTSGRSLVPLSVVMLLCAAGTGYAVTKYKPARSEGASYMPSTASRLLQTWLPHVYDPPSEIFRERYSGIGEDPPILEARAVIGPDCRKLLVHAPATGPILGGRDCGLVASRLAALLDARVDGRPQGYGYIHLAPAEAEDVRFRAEPGRWYATATGKDGTAILSQGWGQSEDWGVWSDGDRSRLTIPCPPADQPAPHDLDLSVSAFVTPTHTLAVDLEVANAPNVRFDFDAGQSFPRTISLSLPAGACAAGSFPVVARIRQPASPASLGISNDGRLLGLGMLGFRLR